MNYAPLHVHFTNGSVGDSVLRVEDFVKKCKEFGITHAAMTDHGSMSAMIDFHDVTEKYQLTPIYGMEAYVVNNMLDRTTYKTSHLVLLAKDKYGVKNLLRIHNYAQLKGFYYKPRTDINYLLKYSSGLIGLSACVAGEIPQAILNNDITEARRKIWEYCNIFDEFYLEIQPGHFKEQLIVNRGLVQLAQDMNIPLVATNDIHYLNAEDYKLHDAHVKSSQKRDDEGLVYADTCYYLMTRQELANRFIQDDIVTQEVIEEALDNTNRIAAQCDGEIEITFEKPSYPYVIEGETEDSQLVRLCYEALNSKIQELDNPEAYTNRLSYELDTIQKLHLSGYMLIVKDLVDHAKSNGISVGPGRGSGVASVVLWLLGVTLADPIKYNLMFERFLSINRKGWADIDLDFDSERRWEMQQYAFERFGQENCAFISTFGIRKAKSALKAAGRLLKISVDTIDEISKTIPFSFYEEDGEKNTDPTLREHLENNVVLKEYQKKYPELFKMALQIESFPCTMGVHAAGIIIGNTSLMDQLPLKIYHDKAHNIDSVATTITKEQVERFRLKYDFLALRTLSIVDKTLANVNETFNFTDNSFDDEAVWNMIGSTNTDGLFQIGSDIYKARMPRLKPKSIQELAACLALIRAPSISAKTDESYMQICEGKKTVESIYPDYDFITKDTNGIVIYQEQVLQLGMSFGLSVDEAYTLLKAVSHKKTSVVKTMKDLFYKNATERQINPIIVDRIWATIESAALYSFNSGHATAYALMCYASAYLKVHYPAQFMANLLTNVYNGNDQKKIHDAVASAKRMGLKFLPVNINHSSWEFTVEDQEIRIGFCAIKALGQTAGQEILSHQPYENFEDFYNKINRRIVNKKIVNVLILSGCFGADRALALSAYYDLKKEAIPTTFSPCKGTVLTMKEDIRQAEKILCKENLYY